MPRKIILSHAMGVPHWSVERLPVAGMKAERVEAYRAEDVEPLVAAAREALDLFAELVPPFPSERDILNEQRLEESHRAEEERREDEAAALDQ